MMVETPTGVSPAGVIMQLWAAGTKAVGSFYEAKTRQYQLRSAALSEEFEASIANINARQAELDAQTALEAGRHEVGRYTLAAGQAQASERARLGGRGLQAGVGSTAETMASSEAVEQLDVLTLSASALHAANASRARAVGLRNQALLAGVSAQNLRDSASGINPYTGVVSSLLGSASRVGSQHQADERYRTLSNLLRRGR